MHTETDFTPELRKLGKEAEESLRGAFEEIDSIAEENQIKVLKAMQKNRLQEGFFAENSGYGYNDIGREALEQTYADTFHTEAALVRPQITCGTHALATALFSMVRPGDEILSPVGKPYDTLEEVIGIRESKGSLREWGVSYRETALREDGSFDYDAIRGAINEKTKLIEIQRSKGYLTRKTFSVEEIGELIAFLRSVKPELTIMVDNCYGEFTETIEPSDVGADMVVGSLIKNPGGGLAVSGGYIAGKEECIEQCAFRLNAPGLGREVGTNFGILRQLFQGLFLAPTVTANAVKTALFAARLFESLGFETCPASGERRYDIVQAVTLRSEEALKAFASGIQSASPVDAFVTPEPWAMPGYDSDVIMAAGTFVSGSSIELSADGPVKPPFNVYFQGGLTYPHGKYGILKAASALIDSGVVKLPFS